MTAPIPPLERLRMWVATQPSKAAAARRIGCHPTYLSHLLPDGDQDSERKPGLNVAFGIEHVTRGTKFFVDAKEWTTQAPAETPEESGTEQVA